MRYIIMLEELAVPFSIGIHDHERVAPQRLLISVSLVTERDVDAGDAIGSVTDYDAVRDYVISLASKGHFELQESVAKHIVSYCSDLPNVAGGAVRTAKPDVYPDAAAVGCQISWGDEAAMRLLATASR